MRLTQRTRLTLVERGCPHARRFTDSIARLPSAHVFNEVVLNQLFVRIPELLAIAL